MLSGVTRTVSTATDKRCDTCGNVRFDGPVQHNCYIGPKGDRVMKISEATEEITRGRTKAPNEFLQGETVTLTAKAVKDGGIPESLTGKEVHKNILPFLSGKTYTIDVGEGEKTFTIINQMREAAESLGMKVSVAPAAGVSAKVSADTKSFRVKWSVKPPKAS